MKSMFAACGVVLCAVVMTACATDESSGSDDDPADVNAVPAEAATIIDVPPELSFAQPEGTFDGNQFSVSPDACHVTLLYCRDPRLHPRIPSFCQNGGCSQRQAREIAIRLCRVHCGHMPCIPIAQFPNSRRC